MRSRAASGAKSKAIGAEAKEDIHTAILLLDLASQHAWLLVKKIADPSRRENFEAQIDTIEQLLQLARQLASNL